MTIKRSTVSRRRALAGAATAGVAVPLLAACGDDSTGATAGDTTSPSAKPTKQSGPTDTATASTPTGDGIPTSEVPVGGGLIQDDVVITQPTKGDFKAFSATCTHQGCIVAQVSDGFIICPCHGSQFAIDTGEPTSDSLATAPLGSVDIKVSGNQITVA